MKNFEDEHNQAPLLSSWLAERDFTVRVVMGIVVIVAPLCSVSSGHFLMGRVPGRDLPDPKRYESQHSVWTRAYAIGRFPVTVAEFSCFVKAGAAKPAPHGWTADWLNQLQQPDHPVVRVTWDDATAYAHWLAEVTGQPWRLPTEAEWEKAARWEEQTQQARVYPWGDHFDRGRANTRRSGPGTTTAVGSYSTGVSPCGAFDMAGNVYEWTSSALFPYPYNAADGRESACQVPPGAYSLYRVRRGGAWDCTERFARCAHRSFDVPFLNSDSQGFRLACDEDGDS